uniref:Uncharacterized protein n=1 Tax=Salvator merianae TaxID=96440 RepID=A0A8D0BMH1_SALMN
MPVSVCSYQKLLEKSKAWELEAPGGIATLLVYKLRTLIMFKN